MRRITALLTLLVAVMALIPGAVMAEDAFEATTENLFTYNPNTGCADRGGHVLTYVATPGSNCGYIYGAPVGEVEAQSQAGVFENARVYTTEAGPEMILDASRTVTGKVRVAARESFCASVVDSTVNGAAGSTVIPCVAHAGTGGGIGEIIVDIAFSGTRTDAGMFGGSTALASTTVSGVILPGDTHIDLAYELTLPAGQDRVSFSDFTFSVDTHGTHIGSGYANASGETTVDIPTLTPVVDEG